MTVSSIGADNPVSSMANAYVFIQAAERQFDGSCVDVAAD
jgi:hypothetical protein